MADSEVARQLDGAVLKAGLSQCGACGAVVKDTEKHEAWHANTVSTLLMLQAEVHKALPSPSLNEYVCPSCCALVPSHMAQKHQRWHDAQAPT